MTELLSAVDAPSDAELISRVRGGDVAAYGELFSRHVEAARRLGRQLVRGPDVDDLVSDAFAKTLTVLQGGGGPDVAFRAYLLTSLRRLHVDKIRASKKVQPEEDMTLYDDGEPFQDTAVMNFEHGAAARAFGSLPERWQLVLWHLEVEGQKPADIAPLLGMSANSVSALAYRAREGLRQAFLTMHLADSATESCRWVNEHLGAYVRKGLSKRDTTKVQEHLDECRRCTAMYLELNEVNSNLAGIIAPLLLGLAGAGYVSSAGGGGATGVTSLFGRMRDAVTGNGAAGSTSSGVAGVGGGAAATAGTAATAGGLLTAGGIIAASVAAITAAAFVFGGGPDREIVAGGEQPAGVVQAPDGSVLPGDSGGPGSGEPGSDEPGSGDAGSGDSGGAGGSGPAGGTGNAVGGVNGEAPVGGLDVPVNAGGDPVQGGDGPVVTPVGGVDAPGGNPGGPNPGGETPGGQTPGGKTPGGQTPGGETPGGETPGGETPGGQTPGGQTPGGETPGGETPGGQTPGGQTPGGETPGGETPGGETPGGETPGDGGETPGDGGGNPGGETPGGGGGNPGGETPGDGGNPGGGNPGGGGGDPGGGGATPVVSAPTASLSGNLLVLRFGGLTNVPTTIHLEVATPEGVSFSAGADCVAALAGGVDCAPRAIAPELDRTSLLRMSLQSTVAAEVRAALDVPADVPDGPLPVTVTYTVDHAEPASAVLDVAIADIGLAASTPAVAPNADGTHTLALSATGTPRSSAVVFSFSGDAGPVSTTTPGCAVTQEDSEPRLLCDTSPGSDGAPMGVEVVVRSGNPRAATALEVSVLPTEGFLDNDSGNNRLGLVLLPEAAAAAQVSATIAEEQGSPERALSVSVTDAPPGPVSFWLVSGSSAGSVYIKPGTTCSPVDAARTSTSDGPRITCDVPDTGSASYSLSINLPPGHVGSVQLASLFAGEVTPVLTTIQVSGRTS